MTNGLTITACIVCLIVCVTADCFREIGCSRKGKEFEIGKRWRSREHQCHSCKCVEAKKYVLECQVAIEKKIKDSVKKSKLSAHFDTSIQYAEDEDVKITEKEAKDKKCPPTKAPTYNWATGTFDPFTYKTVYYYYTRKESRCCSRSVHFTNIHPSCKVVKVNKCRSKVVKKSNPKERCFMSMSFKG
uniref:uncharacterized protein LOC120346949 n=1 Tax=Styela clava TaxID=7725 RepID=UPI0019398580|nr:uncharacterized protein LOC120346949 [Styela clava]